MGGGGGGQTVQKADPWIGQQPYLRDIFANAENLFNQGYGQEYYPGQTVAGFAPQQQQAFDLTSQRALGGSPQQAAMGQYITGTLQQPTVNPYLMAGGGQQLMSGIQPGQQLLQTGGTPTGLGMASNIAGMGRPGAGIDPTGLAQMQATAGGGYLPGSNPYLDQVYGTAAQRMGERFQEETLPALAAQFSGAGRTGSGAQALMLGRAAGEQQDALAKLGADIYAPAYEAERGRQLQAATDLYGTGTQADISRRQMLGDLYSGGLERAIQAGGMLGQLGMGGMEGLTDLYGTQADAMKSAAMMAPAYREMEYGDIDRLAGVGGAVQDQTQRLIDAAVQRHTFGQQAPWQALGQYSNLIQGMPAGAGTTTTTESGGGLGSRLMGGLGGAAAGAGLAGALGPAGAVGMANPYMMPLVLGGGALGIL